MFIQAWGEPATQSLSVVWENYKYIYWYYGEGMEPAEELYDLTMDCLEMDNLVWDPDMQKILEKMQDYYDSHLEKWKAECVQEFNYPKYGRLFDRNIPWEEKRELLIKN